MKDTSDSKVGAAVSSPVASTRRDTLRLLTCGSVDDGKSTLIGRLLLDTGQVFDDHLSALAWDSKLHGTVSNDLDAALLLDGLQAEREQGITIDVAYRQFETAHRRFIVADTPGHVQYTRNMVTGASTSDLAVLLVDATKGISEQTRRHVFLCSLLGIRDVVLAVNKMDLVGFNKLSYLAIAETFAGYASGMALRSIIAIPLSARFGDNVTSRSEQMSWYDGPFLLDYLETIEIPRGQAGPLRFPVQWVNRPNSQFRGYSGSVASGEVRRGDEIRVARSGARSRVARIVTMDGDLEHASAGDAVTLTLANEIDVSRGDVISAVDRPPHVADAFAAHLVWLVESPMLPSRDYLLKCGTRTVTATVTDLKHRVDVTTFAHLAAKMLRINEIGFVNIATHEPIAIDSFEDNRETGSFILIDRVTNATVAAGMIRYVLFRASNLRWQPFDVDKTSRAALSRQKPIILWFTGLSGAGKSTIANTLENKLHSLGKHTYVLDGDNVRHGVNRDLGFTEVDRVENIRRVAEIAKLFVDAGLIVLVAFISPFRAERQMARELVDGSEFVELFVDAPLELCMQRDPKGLYGKAQRGELRNLTGVDSPYEAPENPELRLDTGRETAEALADRVIQFLRHRGMLD